VNRPFETAKELKLQFQAQRAWYFGGPRPHCRYLSFLFKVDGLQASYAARSLPPAPKGEGGLEDLVGRLTSQPAPEPPLWRSFVRHYVERWGPKRAPELFTMPSSHAALGYSRAAGGHMTGVQHLVLVGYAVSTLRFGDFAPEESASISRVESGSYLRLLSDQMHDKGIDELFRGDWETLEKELPGSASALQYYLREGVIYTLDRVKYLPILPIVAEEKGLKTRYPTASLTAANLVQQILRRVLDHIMVNDPRFSNALGGHLDMDMRGEVGPWYSQDATAATDLHAQWLTQGVYEEVARKYPVLQPYSKYFDLLFGPKKLLVTGTPYVTYQQEELAPVSLFRQFPKAPLLDDHYVDEHNVVKGHRWDKFSGERTATIILKLMDNWLAKLEDLDGILTSTGQMMGDPTSFPPLMLHTLFAATRALEAYPYTKGEKKGYHKGLRRSDVVLKGVGDDAQKPRWTLERMLYYNMVFTSMGGALSIAKCFHHPTRSIIAEVVQENGFTVPMLNLGTLVAPPGGSKGRVTWCNQSLAIAGDPSSLGYGTFPKFLWRSSPYYYTWRLADRLGIPISAPGTYGGVGVPIVPHRSQTDHTAWLQYLSQAKVVDLIGGLGLSIGEPSSSTWLDKAARGWLSQVVDTSRNLSEMGVSPVLSQSVLDDSANIRVSLSDAYRSALGRVRATEFYFRRSCFHDGSNPSVRVAARKFQQKVRKAKRTRVAGYGKTISSLEEKSSLYFSRSGGFLPDPWKPRPVSSYGMEKSGEVRTRYIAPFLRGLG